MSRKFTRRKFMAGTAAGAPQRQRLNFRARHRTSRAVQAWPAYCEDRPARAGRIQMEQGIVTFLKEKNYTFAGRKVEFISADTGGNPAGAKTKAQELIERDKVNIILGPLAAFELLAITDYVRSKRRRCQPCRRRGHDAAQGQPVLPPPLGDSAQAMIDGDFAAKELKFKRASRSPKTSPSATSRWPASSGSSKTDGGKIVKKLWPPLVTPTTRPTSRRSTIATACARALPGQSAALHEGLCRGGPKYPGGDRRNRR